MTRAIQPPGPQPAHRSLRAGGHHEVVPHLKLLDRDRASIGQKARTGRVAGEGLNADLGSADTFVATRRRVFAEAKEMNTREA